MDIKDINNELRSNAISCGLCSQWQEEWKDCWDLDKMVSQFYRGIDFFLGNRFVSNEFLKKNFDKDFLRRNGILVDDVYSLLNKKHSILIGKSKSTLRFNGDTVAEVYILDESEAKVVAKNDAFVIIRLLGNASVEVEMKDKARVTAIKHSDQSIIFSHNNSLKLKIDTSMFV